MSVDLIMYTNMYLQFAYKFLGNNLENDHREEFWAATLIILKLLRLVRKFLEAELVYL